MFIVTAAAVFSSGTGQLCTKGHFAQKKKQVLKDKLLSKQKWRKIKLLSKGNC